MADLRPPDILTTPRLSLRPIMIADASSIFAYASDPEATRFMIFPRQYSLAEAEAFARRCVECWDDGSAYPWAICLKDARDFVGAIELRLHPPKADFGYILCPAHWGRGYATEAASAVVGWAIAQPEIYRVWATCHPDNVRSARVLEKAGLKFEARLANWETRPNTGEPAGDSLAYALTRTAVSSAQGR